MKFAEIIRNSVNDVSQFPNCSNINIRLYAGKDRVITEDTIAYSKPIFEENKISLKSFETFLLDLETKEVTSMDIRIDEGSVILFYKDPHAIIFLRKSPI